MLGISFQCWFCGERVSISETEMIYTGELGTSQVVCHSCIKNQELQDWIIKGE